MRHITLLCLLAITTLNMEAQDWPNLNKYAADNAQLAAPKPGEQRVVFMGNSITEGWSPIQPAFFYGKPYVNRGISGQTTPQMLLRFRQDVIALQPAVVVILAGTNDIAGNTGPMTTGQIMDNIKGMAELARANEIKVILCSVLPAFDYPWKPGKNPDKVIPELNAMIKAYCTEKGIHYLDYFSEMADERNGLPKSLAEDGVHPNKQGYEIMAALADKAIAKVLAGK